MNEPAQKRSKVLSLPGAVSPVALELPAGLTFEEWEAIGAQLGRVAGALNWWLGDWWLHGERAYGEAASQAAPTGRASETLRRCAWVAQRIESVRRRTNLSWSAHAEVAGLDPDAQDRLLDAAEDRGLSTRELRQAVTAYRRALTDKPEPERLVRIPVTALRAAVERCGCDDLAEYLPDDDDPDRPTVARLLAAFPGSQVIAERAR